MWVAIFPRVRVWRHGMEQVIFSWEFWPWSYYTWLDLSRNLFEFGFEVFHAFNGDGIDVAEEREMVGRPQAQGNGMAEFFEEGGAFDGEVLDGYPPLAVEVGGGFDAGLVAGMVGGVA